MATDPIGVLIFLAAGVLVLVATLVGWVARLERRIERLERPPDEDEDEVGIGPQR
jgi:hypothetical protein